MTTLLEDSKIITHEIYEEMKNSYIDYADVHSQMFVTDSSQYTEEFYME